MIDYQEHDRKRAVYDVFSMLRSPLALLSADREVVYELVRLHKITTEDLLDYAVQRARNT